MKIIVSYCRVSTTKQSKDGIGLDIQKMSNDKSITRILSNDKSLTRIDDIHESISAKDGANLSTLMAIATNRKYSKGSIIVIYDQTRFSRTLPLVAITAMSELLKLGFNIHLSAEDKTIASLDTLDELIVPLVNAASARKESIDRSNRTSDSYQKRLTSGMQNYGGHTPNWIKIVYGDKGEPCDYELIPERQTIINKIYQMYIDGAGANAIVRYLNENINPWSEYDSRRTSPVKNWGESYISKILINRSVIGERTFNKTNEHALITVTDYYPPAISKELFYQAQTIRKARGRDQVHITKHPTIFYIGVAYCGYCGSKMIGQNYKDKSAAIRCVGHSKGEVLNCAGGSSPAKYLERVIIELCKDQVNFNEIFNPNDNELDSLKVTASQIQESIGNVDDKLTRLEDLYLDGEISKERYLQRKQSIPEGVTPLKQQLQSIEQQIDKMTHYSIKENTAEFLGLLEQVKVNDIPQATRLKLKDLLKKFITRIDVYRYGMQYRIDGTKDRENLTYGIRFKSGAFRVIHFSHKLKSYTHGIGDNFVLNNMKPKSTDELIEWLASEK
jgi:DNA invertase Pin-like site-specific DNA recombinase